MRRFFILLSTLAFVARAADPQFYTVFKPNDGKYPCYRQPAILTTNAERTHLLVFAEGRFVSSCAPPLDGEVVARNEGPNENGGLEMRRSLDGGSTWLPQTTLYSGNIDFYTILWDSTSNMIYLMLEAPGGILIFISRDEGVTWSDPVRLNVLPPPPFTKAIRPAIGHGIEIVGSLCKGAACSDAGTLLMPFICQNGSSHGDNGSCPSCYACVLKSEMPKQGQNRTWNFTGVGQQYTRESQLVQTINNGDGPSHVYLNERNFSPSPGHRYYARSTNGGDRFTEFGIDQSLVEPVTQAWTGVVCSIERVSTSPSRILFSGPANATVRADLTLRLSYDEAHTWTVSRVLYSGLSAYSDTAVIGNGDNVALVFENGEQTFADRISVALVPVAWIENKER